MAAGAGQPIVSAADGRAEGSPSARIAAAVTSWEGVTTAPHRFGGVEFLFGRRELGHLHGDSLADLPFPKRVAAELVESGRARPHRFVRDSGWVSKPLRGEADVEDAIALFRLAYERATAAAGRRSGTSA